MHRPSTAATAAGLRLLLVAVRALGSWLPSRANAHMQGMYKTKAAAEKRAQELKCAGAFPMGGLWLPCANEQALHKAIQTN
jgi:hypothetical protein